MNIWVVMIITGMITYAFRLSFIILFERKDLPPALQRWLRYVPPAVFAAIIFPEIFVRDGLVVLSSDNSRLFAALIAAIIAWRTKNVLLTILIGMAALLIIQAIQNQL
jgi:branched-subunit amino acid transport protein